MEEFKISTFILHYSIYIYTSDNLEFFVSFPNFDSPCIRQNMYPRIRSLAILSYIYIYIYVSFLFGCKSAGNFTIRMERRFAASLSSASTLRPPCIYTIVALYAWKLLTYADIRARRGGGEDGRRGGRLATRQMEWNGIIRGARRGMGEIVGEWLSPDERVVYAWNNRAFWNVNPGLFWILEGLRFPDMA